MAKKFIPVLYTFSTRVLSRVVTYPTMQTLTSPNILSKSAPLCYNLLLMRCSSNKVLNAQEATRLRNEEGVCWSCRVLLDKLSKFFCSKCGSVIPAKQSENYFTLFETKPDFKIELSDLQLKFKNLQRQLHPDKFSLKTPVEISLSEELSSQLNKAYFTLLKPLSRGIYMLELEGVFIGEDVSSNDPDFLLKIMEINEEIADMSTVEEYRSTYNDVKDTVDNLTVDIANAFHQKDLSLAKSLIIAYKYYDNIIDKLKDNIPPS